MKVSNSNLISSSTSLATSWTSEAINVEHSWFLSAQVVMTGVPAGNWKLQGSNDEVPLSTTRPQTGVTNWTDVGSASVTVSAAGSLMLEDADVGYAWVRVVYTATGAGTSPLLTSARLVAKGV